jgi:hypothetical protein
MYSYFDFISLLFPMAQLVEALRYKPEGGGLAS